MSNSMINPSIVDLLKRVDNRYTLITITSKRARQLIEGSEPMVDIKSTKPVTIAINEIDKGLVDFETVIEGIK
ncbi:DNA-directed RNA polymerase subunit omega [Clostridium tyrobutyricum]|jgi:DNA-directed RNA polymerase subunit omega|uniref:DNA-directed RNA polymerase subunit omega n=1 Tax=Clostridium tyrobutyricum DIVETGP TaxID=1408889 RepID=W6N2R0_CLOTY|nr:DNA-directed RNA polymerase subunit omega [Clostridium tyrobutyricum]AND85101.1 DNA-directed RNA polymerase subunit omega [Clostridium tyrobutyricum]ANP69659.1 DNA-directed RNA polymerase subunit omega [Clostridium tyrobutyricum]MBR9647006.1 DNA-directed RNA polymerase subunit omega [Clostridium tyrobutyricum]MBV4414929.1 DNA-directed RNA polymerase subunit omega [Clostridium tyrobutyricum]MBV4420789.1 DNA-directed RNA polymerase subunit omega [Clostridium tyrobutyricum]